MYGGTDPAVPARKRALAGVVALLLGGLSVALVLAARGAEEGAAASDETQLVLGRAGYDVWLGNQRGAARRVGETPCAFCPVEIVQPCMWTADCADQVTIASDGDAAAWAAKGCDHVGGSMTIKSAAISADGLKNLTGLTRICGAFAIQQLTLPSLDGLNNLALVGGSMAIQQNAWGANDAGSYLASLDALEKLDYIGGGLTIQQNFYLEDLDGIGGAQVGGTLDIQLYPGCSEDCGGSFACLSACTPTALTEKCATCDNSTLAPVQALPTPQPSASTPQPSSSGGSGRCCFWSPAADACSDCEGHWAPPTNWCAPEERCKSSDCTGATWCPDA